MKKRIRIWGRPAVPNIRASPREIAETGSLSSPTGAALLRDQVSALRTAFDVGEGSKKKPAKTTYSKRKG